MIEASDSWKDIQQRFLLPETFVEIDCAVTEIGLQEQASIAGSLEAVFSDTESALGLSDTTIQPKYATLEPNLWALDGTHTILPDKGPYENAGYVSDVAESGSVSMGVGSVREVMIPGVTIVWSSEYEGEYPHVFSVVALNNGEMVAETTVTDNQSRESVVYLDIVNYDSVIVTIHNWSYPNHRPRMDLLKLGHSLTFTKDDIISYTHEQHGDLLSGELPKYSIEFTVDNTDGRWNPSNPTGLEKYLSERQQIKVRYGMDVGGKTEWIKAGTFYLSEWSAPSNGLEARFVARDLFEFLIARENVAAFYATLGNMITYQATVSSLPAEGLVHVDASLEDYSAGYNGDGTNAEIVQKSANAGCCIMRFDRNGELYVEPLNTEHSGFTIPMAMAYSYPEITLSKPLGQVAVEYGAEVPYELNVATSGEKQSVDNSFIHTEERAALVATWVADILKYRTTVSGEFRADPRLDVFDVVTVESKFGTLSPVVLTEIKYTFTGAFSATYTGRVLA